MNKDGLIYLPRTEESVPTPRTRKNAIHVPKSRSISKPENFEKAMHTLKTTGKLDGFNFSDAAELGMFIDYNNDIVQKSKDKDASNNISEISKFLVRISTSKTFIPGKKKTDT